jgi:hypothetical protein
MNKIKLLALAVFTIGGYVSVAGQQTALSDLSECANLRMVEEKPALKLKAKPVSNVKTTVPDVLSSQFELKDNCSQTIYYLAFNVPNENTKPALIFLYRNKDSECSGAPTWFRRSNLLTSPGLYHWLPIRTGESIKFEYASLSRIQGERTIAMYVNYYPRQEEMRELLAEPFSIKK